MIKKQSFIYGAAVLAAASLLCKIMSAAMKIPLDRFFLHEEGIAVYQSAYSIYNVFLAICVTGIPIALSSLVASSEREEGEVLAKSTGVLVTLFCLVGAVLLFAFSRPIAKILSGGGKPEAQLSLQILAPALLVMGIISSRRGYFQGKCTMTPSAYSQLAESFIKVVFGITLCAFFMRKGIAHGAFGAMCGVSLGAVISAAILELYYRKNVKIKVKADLRAAMKVIKLSLPMTLGAFGFTGVMLIDSLTTSKILSLYGVGELERLKMFGYLTRANTIYNLPATIITAIAASAVPAVSAAFAKRDKDSLSENTLRGVKLIFIVAFPCALGMMLFSKEILNLLYLGSPHYMLLVLTGVMILLLPYIQVATAMLQALGRVWTPIWVTVGALCLKVILNFVFIKAFGIEGAPLATIIAFVPAFIINTVLLYKSVSMRGSAVHLKIALCAIVSCIAARLLYELHETTLMLLVSIAFAGAVYAAGIFLSGCIKKEELKRGA